VVEVEQVERIYSELINAGARVVPYTQELNEAEEILIKPKG
jgi:hypothetical protein